MITASVAGLQQLPFDPYHALSKHAVVGLMRSLSGLQSRGIRVNAIFPGEIDTGIAPDLPSPTAMSPRSYIPDVVVQVLELGEGGEIWIALGETHGAWTIEPPALTAPPGTSPGGARESAQPPD